MSVVARKSSTRARAGANKGIGLEIARTIGQTPGHLCIMACRDQERGEQAAKTLKGQGCKVQFMQVENPLHPSMNL